MAGPILAAAARTSHPATPTSFTLPAINPGGPDVVLYAFLSVDSASLVTITPDAPGWVLKETNFADGTTTAIFRKAVPLYAGPYHDSFSVAVGAVWGGVQFAFRATGADPGNSAEDVDTYGLPGATDPTSSVALPSPSTPGHLNLGFVSIGGYGPPYIGSNTWSYAAGWAEIYAEQQVGIGCAYRVADGTPGEDTFEATRSQNKISSQITFVVEDALEADPEPVAIEAWDVYAADALDGQPLATLENAEDRMFRVEEDGHGMGAFAISRYAPEATEAILARGNMVRVRIPRISTDYIAGFFLEEGDFDLLSSSEEGGELLTFAGKGSLSYLHRARMDPVAYSTGLDTVDTWELEWKTSAVPNPVGACLLDGDTDFVYVISATTRKVYKIRQSDRKVVNTSPPLWSGSTNYAGGLSSDPADPTILWALEAPWSRGGSGDTKIRKIDVSGGMSTWAVADTFNLGSPVKLTEVQASASHLWVSRYENTNTIQKRSKADGSVVNSYDPDFNGDLNLATGVSYNATEDLLAYWFAGKQRAYIADPSAPGTIIDRISTKGLSAFGGAWTTEGPDQFFYPVSYTADLVWKYRLTSSTPHDPVDGIWRLDEGTPGAILARIMQEVQHPSRPQQPVPELSYAFTYDDDSGSNPWESNPGTAEFTASVGDYVDETVLRLVPYGLTLQMSPLLELGAYNEADWGTDRTAGSFAAGKVRLEAGVNIEEGLQGRMDEREVDSHLVVMGEAGAFARAVQDDQGYVREGFLSTSLSDQGALEGTGEAELARQRRDADAQTLQVPWLLADESPEAGELEGRYMPGPAGTNGRYWLGDTIRVHTGSGEWDLQEADRQVKAITVEEQSNGEWVAVADLAAIFYPIYDPQQPISKGGTSIGGGGGGGSTTVVKQASVVVKDARNGESYSGGTIESEDWGVSQPGTGRVEVSIRRSRLAALSDVEVDAIADGQGIAWDAALEQWVPVELGAGGLGLEVAAQPWAIVWPRPAIPGTSPLDGNIVRDPANVAYTIVNNSRYNAFGGLTVLKTGELLAGYQDSSDHNVTNDGICRVRVSRDLGHTWSDPITVYDGPGSTHVLHCSLTTLRSGRVIATFGTRTSSIHSAWTAYSDDHGRTWSAPVPITPAGFDECTVTCPVVELEDGTLVVPIEPDDTSFGGTVEVGVMFSTDHGESWSGYVQAAFTSGKWLGEPWIVKEPGGTELKMFIRNETDKVVQMVSSTDGGATWSSLSSALFSAWGRPSAVWLESGGIVILNRQTTLDGEGRAIYRTSWDGGTTWEAEAEVDDDGLPFMYGVPLEVVRGVIAFAYHVQTSSTNCDMILRWMSDGTGFVLPSGTSSHGAEDGYLGFYGAPPVERPTITGERDANPAVAALLSGLEAQGLLTDGTTAGTSGGGAGDLILVDHGAITYDDSGDDIDVAIATVWGIDADGAYYDDAGAAVGEEAVLYWDPVNHAYVARALEVEP